MQDSDVGNLQTVIAILSEHGDSSTMTEAVLQEYGKTVWSDDAIKQLVHYFS